MFTVIVIWFAVSVPVALALGSIIHWGSGE
jgi:hypothetical protein